jgi:hypothetical protein
LDGEGLPSFVLVREFAANAPWEQRDENEDLPGWAKMIIHVEVCETKEYLIRDSLHYLVKTGEFNLHFGEFAWVVNNPGGEVTLAEKQALGLDIEQHSAVMLCIGKVHLQGVRDAEYSCMLDLMDDDKGRPRAPVKRTLKQVLMSMRVDKKKLWQCIAPSHDGGWDGYYTNRRGCEGHKTRALELAGSTAAQMKFHMLARGVDLESIEKLLERSCTMEACMEAADAKLRNGKVVTMKQAQLLDARLKMEKSSWLQLERGMGRKKREQYILDKAQAAEDKAKAVDSKMTPGNKAAYNFGDDNSMAPKKCHKADDNASTYTKYETATLGGTAYGPGEDESSAGSIESRESDVWYDEDDNNERRNERMEFDTSAMETDEHGRKGEDNNESMEEDSNGEKSNGNHTGGSGEENYVNARENMDDDDDSDAVESYTSRASTYPAYAAGMTKEEMEDIRKKMEGDHEMAAANAMMDMNASHNEEYAEGQYVEPQSFSTERTPNEMSMETFLQAKAGQSLEEQMRILQDEMERLRRAAAPPPPEQDHEPNDQTSNATDTADEATLQQRQAQPSSATEQPAEGAAPPNQESSGQEDGVHETGSGHPNG